MVINSPCLTDKKEWAIPRQTATGKEFSNPLMAGSLPKTISTKVSTAVTNLVLLVDFLSTCLINYALTVSPTIYASYIKQLWNTATSKIVNSIKQIHDIVDGKAVVISDSSVRNDLLFDDEDGKVKTLEQMRLSIKRGDGVERAITTDASLVAAQDSDNIIRTQTTAMPNVDIPRGMDTGGSLIRA
ncbi:hypothetical protein Tco_1226209 [Tanacetum coccineum]